MAPQPNPALGVDAFEKGWWQCNRCLTHWFSPPKDDCRRWEAERPDLHFRGEQLTSAIGLMVAMGVQAEKARPDVGFIIDKHYTLARGSDARFILLRQDFLPRIALYWRGLRVIPGEGMSVDTVFQCDFAGRDTVVDRRAAPERALDQEQFNVIVGRTDGGHNTLIRCQHCQRPLPLRSLNMLSLRECEKGD